MTTTTIEQIDPATGVQLDVRPDLRARVESAARLLEGEIGDLEPVDVTARWQYWEYPDVGLRIRLHLGFRDRNLMIQFMPRDFDDLDKLRKRLRQAVSDLHFMIMDANRKALRIQLDRLAATSSAEV
jgi:hypothetical protein